MLSHCFLSWNQRWELQHGRKVCRFCYFLKNPKLFLNAHIRHIHFWGIIYNRFLFAHPTVKIQAVPTSGPRRGLRPLICGLATFWFYVLQKYLCTLYTFLCSFLSRILILSFWKDNILNRTIFNKIIQGSVSASVGLTICHLTRKVCYKINAFVPGGVDKVT